MRDVGYLPALWNDVLYECQENSKQENVSEHKNAEVPVV